MFCAFRNIIITALILLLSSGMCLADAQADYDCGLELQQQKQYRAAIAEFAKVPSDSPLAAKACYQTAQCYSCVTGLDDAIEACRKGLASASTAEDRELLGKLLEKLRFGLPIFLMQSRKWDDAIAEFRKLVEDYPENAKWHIAYCCLHKRDYDHASLLLDELLSAYPASKMAGVYTMCRARCSFFQGREIDAIAEITEAIARYPDDLYMAAENVELIAYALTYAKRPAEAESWYRRLIEANPQPPSVIAWKYGLARQLYAADSWADARALFQEILDRYGATPWSEGCLYMVGKCCEKLADWPGARKAWEECISRFLDSPEAKVCSDLLRAIPPESGEKR